MPEILHNFHSDKDDGTDSTLVKPSNWNANHDMTVSAASVVGAVAGGPVSELPLVTSPPDDTGTIWTKKAIEAAIASAIANVPSDIPVGSTLGWYKNTLPTGRWLFANGQTIGNAGSGATARANIDVNALFVFLWGLPNSFCPVLPSRGASAAADWASTSPFKTLGLPDECGRVSAGADNMGGITTKGRLTSAGLGVTATAGAVGGSQLHQLVPAEMPLHRHKLLDDPAYPGAGALGVAMGGTAGFVSSSSNAGGIIVETETAGGDPAATPPHSVTAAHKNVQPTIIRNVLIKY